MIVNSIEQFNQLIKVSGISNSTPSLAGFTSCINEYLKLCACDSEEYKKSKINQCHELYRNSVHELSGIKNKLFKQVSDNTIIFNDNGKHIRTLNR